MLISLVPVVVVLALFSPRLSYHLERTELFTLLVALVAVTLLVPPTRDLAGRFLDKYVYRAQVDYQRTVRDASRALTRVLKLDVLLAHVARAVEVSMRCEGVAVYLKTAPGEFTPNSIVEARDEAADACIYIRSHVSKRRDSCFATPDAAPAIIIDALTAANDCVVTDEVGREPGSDRQHLHELLSGLGWALVLPLRFEDGVIGAVAVGPKLSGDPFYPQDLDLLMTLANQAGIAVKNAQLYTQVVVANEYIENIVATIESGVLAMNATGQITMFNRAAEQLTGLRADEVKSRSLPILPGCLSVALRQAMDEGRPLTQPEVALPTGGDATRPVICTTSPLRDPEGRTLGAVAVFSDLTPLKELEAERRRVERLAYFQVLASSLAHEIKNPLVAVKTFAQLIPLRSADAGFVNEFSRIVTREIDRMERLIGRLQTLARPGDRPNRPVDLRGPLGEALEFLRPTFEEKRITVTVAAGDEPRVVMGDHGELEQLFFNLLLNAHEATPPDGAVSIEVTATDEDVTVAVGDSGPGIPPEYLDQVFDPFFTTKQRGSGLGLAICAGIAGSHRAKLQAANRPGGGARFTVSFPLPVPVGAPSRV